MKRLNSVKIQLISGTLVLGAVYALLYGMGLGPWVLDCLFIGIALILWLGRRHKSLLVLSIGTFLSVVIGQTDPIGLTILLVVPFSALVWGTIHPDGLRKISQPFLDKLPFPLGKPLKSEKTTLSRAFVTSALRITATVVVICFTLFIMIGPIGKVLNAGKRRETLLKFVRTEPAAVDADLSELALRLKQHVVHLSEVIGERGIDKPEAQDSTLHYIADHFRVVGMEPRIKEYKSLWRFSRKHEVIHQNVEAVWEERASDDAGVWVLGAHYDTVPGTSGADDNASGVAMLLELARMFAADPPRRPMHFVAYGTEEPPSFGTRNMGSYQHARDLKARGTSVAGMISLEMVGYYNCARGSQLYPPFLHPFYPDKGDYVALVSNYSSRGILRECEKLWKKHSTFPLETSVLPSIFSNLAMSDQLNYWAEGYPALLLTDTSFFRNPHYHRESDLPETLDYEKMAAVTKGLFHVVQNLK